jgi:hypothetical protein
VTTDDSAAANPFKIYRFASEADLIAGNFTLAFSGDIRTGTDRWGDSFAVRGSGSGTQIAIGSGTGGTSPVNTSLAVLTTTDGSNFTPTVFSTIGLMAPANDQGPARQGITFGDGNVLWGKESGDRLFRATFDLSLGTLTATNVIATASFPATGGALEFVPGTDTLLFNSHALPREVRVYDVSNPASPVLSQSFGLGTNISDSNVAGEIHYAGGRAYALQSNNGIYALVPEPSSMLCVAAGVLLICCQRMRSR